MTWLEHHQKSELLAADAEVAARNVEHRRAEDLYRQAAESEERALGDLDPSKSRTRGVSAVSAVSLYYKAGELTIAEGLAYKCMAADGLPDFAAEQLRGLLQSVWSEQTRLRAGVGFAPGQVLVSVKGGEVIEGGAPLDLIVEKVQTVRSLFYRTAEFIQGLPHRKRGDPEKEIQDSCRPWLFQAAPGSYQFAVAVQEAKQREMFHSDEPRPVEIAKTFLNIVRACIEAPEEELPEIVPDGEYRGTFLKLTRNLAPSGKRFDQLDIRSADETRTLTLVPSTRTLVNQAIRASRPAVETQPETEDTIRGALRALHLDEDWIEVAVDDRLVRIDQVVETVDDVIGPMVNHPVIVQVVRDHQGRLHFRDIETDD